MNKPIITPGTGEKDLVSLTARGTTKYGKPVSIRYEVQNGRLMLIIEDERADGAALKELRKEAKRYNRMTITCDGRS